MKRTITTYLISIIILTILVLLFHLYNWPGTNFSVYIGISILVIIALISIIRSKRKGIYLIVSMMSVLLFVFTTGLSLNQYNIRYSIWPFGERLPGFVKNDKTSQTWYNNIPKEEIIEQVENSIIGIEDHWFTRSFVVIMDDEVVLEKYFNNATPNNAFNLKSATKSVTSALIGIAIDKGLIKSVDQKLSEFFPEYFEDKTNADKSEITIRHLLTMQAGYNFHDNNKTGFNWTESIINSSLTFRIGEKFCYSDCQSHVLAAIIEKTAKMSVDEFAKANLFEPIQATIGYWAESPDGINKGYVDLYLTPRDMARFGNLYLNEGQLDDNQIISKEWISASLKDYSSGKERCDQIQFDSYGFNWWKKSISGFETYSAVGWGGQMIMIVPELDVVIVNVNEPNVSGYDCGVNTDISLKFIENVLETIMITKTISS